jgi:beta-N-acetylhexosaminidase
MPINLRAAPFHLDDEGVAWVNRTLAGLTPDERVGQLFNHLSWGPAAGQAASLAALAPGGVTRFALPDQAAEVAFIDDLRRALRVPPLVSADLEGSRLSSPFGTTLPNPLALAAVDDLQATRTVARVTAVEARAMGINWSFTPVLDINAAFRSSIVATRGFGSDPDRIRAHALATIDELQSQGIAATVKHWPGEGHDDRDQHLVTTQIPLTVDQWEATHGGLYRAAIDTGVLAVMSAHIGFPAYVQSLNPHAGVDAFRPASVSHDLNVTLLRDRLGFNGVIVSDATPMGGFGAWGPRDQMLPEVIANGCDMILFSNDPVADHALIARAIADGRINRARHDAALTRILALKAALGLHRGWTRAADLQGDMGTDANRAAVRAVTARAPTLVKDVQGTLPLSPTRTPRVIVFSSGVVSPMDQGPVALDLPDMLAAQGFDVTVFDPKAPVNPRAFDLAIYLIAEETLLTRGRIFLDWSRICGGMVGAMDRLWHDMPVVMISFGYPYLLYDAPRAPCYINAYSTTTDMQAAVVDCLTGRAPWRGVSPVDPFCGLPDARY